MVRSPRGIFKSKKNTLTLVGSREFLCGTIHLCVLCRAFHSIPPFTLTSHSLLFTASPGIFSHSLQLQQARQVVRQSVVNFSVDLRFTVSIAVSVH